MENALWFILDGVFPSALIEVLQNLQNISITFRINCLNHFRYNVHQPFSQFIKPLSDEMRSTTETKLRLHGLEVGVQAHINEKRRNKRIDQKW